METGYRILPEDLPGAIFLFRTSGKRRYKRSSLTAIVAIRKRAQELMPVLHQLRASAEPFREHPRARLRVPLLKHLLEENGMGGSEWRGEFATGFPILGELGEPGVYPHSTHPSSYISREELFEKARDRSLSSNRTSDPNARQLWCEAIDQVKKGEMDLIDSMNTASSWLTANPC